MYDLRKSLIYSLPSAIVGGAAMVVLRFALRALDTRSDTLGLLSLTAIFAAVAVLVLWSARKGWTNPAHSYWSIWQRIGIGVPLIVAGSFISVVILVWGFLFIYFCFVPLAIVLAFLIDGLSVSTVARTTGGVVGSLAGWAVVWVVFISGVYGQRLFGTAPAFLSDLVWTGISVVMYGFNLGFLLADRPRAGTR